MGVPARRRPELLAAARATPALTAPAAPTPEAAVLACLHDALGLEVDENAIGALTNLTGETLTTTLTALVKVGKIEHVRPGYYRKNT